MKKLSFLLMLVLLFAFSGCAKEDESTMTTNVMPKGVEGQGMKVAEPRMGMDEGLPKEFTETVSPRPSVASETPAMSGGDTLLVADFNSGVKPSNIGGNFGAWDKDPADFSQTCTDVFDPLNNHGQSGFGMKLDYDVDSSNPAYNGFWMKLENLDVSNYGNLVFFVKGDEEAGYTTVFKVELKSANGEVGKFYITGISSDWKEISIPLNQFQGISEFSSLSEFVIVFEDTMATNKDGIIYIDDIQFTK